jgi:hypothetical protein
MFIVCVVAAGRGAKLIDDKVLGIARLAAESLAFLHPAIALNSKRNSGQKVNLKSDYYNSPARFKHSFGPSIRFFPEPTGLPATSPTGAERLALGQACEIEHRFVSCQSVGELRERWPSG